MVLFFCFEWFFLLRINLFVCIEITMCITFDKIQKSYKIFQRLAHLKFRRSIDPDMNSNFIEQKNPWHWASKEGECRENWFSSRWENHDCSCWIGRNHISSWENKILPCPARVCWKNLLFTKPWQYHDMWYNISLR